MAPKQLTRTYKPVGACKSTTAQFMKASNGRGRNALWLSAFYVSSRVDRERSFKDAPQCVLRMWESVRFTAVLPVCSMAAVRRSHQRFAPVAVS